MGSKIGEYLKKKFEDKLHNFDAGLWDGGDFTVVYRISGADGGTWSMGLVDKQPFFQEEDRDKPDISIGASSADFLAMLEGRLNPQMAMLKGKLKYQGNRLLMLKLRQLLG